MHSRNKNASSNLLASQLRPKRLSYFVGLVLLLSTLGACASAPPVEEPVQREDNNAAEQQQLEELKALEEKVKGSIARAESAGAAELSPVLLDEAYLNLRSGQEKDPKADGAAQRLQFIAAIEKADAAYDDTVAKSRQRWLRVITNYEDDLEELKAAHYMPAYNARSRILLQELRSKIAEGNNEESLALYQSTIPNVDAVVTALLANLDSLDQLRQQVIGLMGEASRQELSGISAEFESQGQAAYENAMEHQVARGDLQSMEQDLFDARYYLRESLRLSGALDPSRIDALLRKLQKQLEKASQHKRLGAENEILGEAWNGELYLAQNPLVDLNSQFTSTERKRKRDESRLKRPNVSADFLETTNVNPSKEEEPDPASEGQGLSLFIGQDLDLQLFSAEWQLNPVTQQSNFEQNSPDSEPLNAANSRVANPFTQEADSLVPMNLPSSIAKNQAAKQNSVEEQSAATLDSVAAPTSQTVVSTAQEYVSDDGTQNSTADLLSDAQLLLKQAIRSWENGVQARNKGDLPKAQHYLEESARLLDQYNMQYAVLGYYTVRRLSPADCLWRIAGYADVYGDPFQWTRIYQRNRDQIHNPSLIYPGQRLIIPPLE